ncbi:RtcB family protein [Timonella senegalensis]|uniref:RtcB family protein n=1 Tax=Timonella senegalensis TaxID=1465825 RepID=UPI0002E3EA0C|nr:RtcB family protein [Timonella senegalensis]
MTFPVTLSGTSTLMWARESEIEQEALAQLRNISALPWVHGVRVMPDVHLGKGATVGSVIAMKDAVSPNAVGVDIGCGMIGVLTSLTASDLPDDLSGLRHDIERAIPTGWYGHKSALDAGDSLWSTFDSLHAPVSKNEQRIRTQLGTLGGGNHFIELCLDDQDRVWLQLHSGSRAVGKMIADWHVSEAKGLEHNLSLPDRDLAVFLSGTAQMDAYMHDLTWAQAYAAESRAQMMRILQSVVTRHFSELDVRYEQVANVHHNYVQREHIDGEDLIVTRKGAIRATQGLYGLIPGSMGTGSYIVKGLGNPKSYFSASHGAGRTMSRTKAKKMFTAEDLIAQTAGVECRKDEGVVDEIPAAYKNLDDVIAAQSDLIEVVVRLRTILCVKG